MKPMTMWTIASNCNWGWDYETFFPTEAKAKAALDALYKRAEEEDKVRAEWLAAHPKPWDEKAREAAFINGYDGKSRIENLNYRKLSVVAKEVHNTVFRLNTLPDESGSLVEEIEAKVKHFGTCDLDWSCTGHTRSCWQSDAAAAQLSRIHPEWKVEAVSTGYRKYVHIEAKK